MKRHQGFTLIEIMIGIAILGILAAIATVSYTLYTKKTIVSVALSEISALKTEYEMTVNENYSDLGSLSNIDMSASKYCTLDVYTPDSTTFIAEKALVCTLKIPHCLAQMHRYIYPEMQQGNILVMSRILHSNICRQLAHQMISLKDCGYLGKISTGCWLGAIKSDCRRYDGIAK